ncbi:MAG TPA: ester cyclase [Candidatus Baltobacteraceae bacterium]|nr:ester cyclase [Candidatus Baltobacteraceae bacterium]
MDVASVLSQDSAAARLALVREHVAAENAHDLAHIMSTFGDSARYDDEPWNEHHVGRGGVQAYYEDLLKTLPDLFIDVQREHVSPDCVILEVVIRGTHVGNWRGLPGTGRRVAVKLCGVYTFDEQNRLAGERIYYDRAEALQQVGMFHDPESLLGRITTMLAHPATVARIGIRKLFGRRAGG